MGRGRESLLSEALSCSAGEGAALVLLFFLLMGIAFVGLAGFPTIGRNPLGWIAPIAGVLLATPATRLFFLTIGRRATQIAAQHPSIDAQLFQYRLLVWFFCVAVLSFALYGALAIANGAGLEEPFTVLRCRVVKTHRALMAERGRAGRNLLVDYTCALPDGATLSDSATLLYGEEGGAREGVGFDLHARPGRLRVLVLEKPRVWIP